MKHRAILACFVALVLAVAFGGPGCANGGSVEGGDDAGDDGTIIEGGDAIACSAPKAMCGSSCVNLSNDPQNCGQCGAACGMAQVCDNGACSYSCSPPQTLCGGPTEAGAEDASGGGATVEGGGGASDSGASGSDGGSTQPYCSDLGSDPDNCGGCGKVCPPMHTCNNGMCGLVCPTGQKACIAGDTCIPDQPGVCCSSADCPITGQICPMPGGTCQCPGGEKPCSKTSSCISSNDCCTQQDCTVTGSTCVTPGQACQCSNGQKACSATNSCIPQSDCCVPADCGAPGSNNVSNYSCTSGACGIASCTAGCYNLDGTVSNGCECCDDTLGKSCSAPTGLGQLALGQSITNTGQLPGANESDWLQVTFSNEGNTAFHAHIYFAANPNGEFAFDLDSNCSPAPLACAEGGGCTQKTEWEVKYTGGDPTGQTWGPIAAIGTVYIRVYRVSGAPTCDQYQLVVTE